MGFFERLRHRHELEREPEQGASWDYDDGEPGAKWDPDEADGPDWETEPEGVPEPVADPNSSTVSRTLVKSEPELAELVSSDPRLSGEGLDVNLAEKGFGTRVEISAPAGGDLGLQELEQLLDDLAEPQKRPFSTG